MNAEQIREAIELTEQLIELLEYFDIETNDRMRRKSLKELLPALRRELGQREQEQLRAFAGAPELPGMVLSGEGGE